VDSNLGIVEGVIKRIGPYLSFSKNLYFCRDSDKITTFVEIMEFDLSLTINQGNLIKQLIVMRKARKITQTTMAKRMGINVNTLIRIESVAHSIEYKVPLEYVVKYITRLDHMPIMSIVPRTQAPDSPQPSAPHTSQGTGMHL
tara:strand:+ start:3862 stop:4290 length:429 start_codon:yes stop_codon:yes gene_type:complete